MACPGCGAEGFHTAYSGDEGDRMKITGECFSCAFWELRCAAGEKLVIGHHVYGVDREPRPDENRSFLGMGGRRFDIELFDGRRFTTHNLWSGGQIPERYHERLPNTARFVTGGYCQVGETGCWNPSPESAPAYPSYFDLPPAVEPAAPEDKERCWSATPEGAGCPASAKNKKPGRPAVRLRP